MANEIQILHISDLHAKLSDKDKLQSRMNALLDDIARQNLGIDLLAFTGDIAFSGKKEEYELANELLFVPLLRRFQLSPKKVFVIPGNHDVNRTLIDQMEEAGLKKSLKTPEAASSAFKNQYGGKRLTDYSDHFKTKYNGSANPFAFHSLSLRGFDIGIASLNSAWRCSSDKDEGNDPKNTAEQIASADLSKKVDYEKYDDGFDKRKNAQTQNRITQLRPKSPTCQADELGTRILALKTFYNLFRNLENISGEEKVKLLDQVLDLHISCNLSLIEFMHTLQGEGATSDFRTVTAYLVTMGGQMFLANNIGNQSLQETILAAMKASTNELKRLLLVCLYGDLRLPGYQKHLEDYVTKADTMIAVELIYLQTRFLLITHDSLQVPASSISAFQAAFRRRHQLYGDKTTKGSFDKAYSADFEAARLQHLNYFNAQEALMRAGNYE